MTLTAEKSPSVAKQRVLVIDDEETVQLIIRTVLERDGFEVKTACDGSDGLQFLLQDDADLVIVDYQMRKMDGVTFIQEARKLWPWLGIIICSAFLDEKVEERVRSLGVTQILHKPFKLNELRSCVSQELAHRQTHGDAPELDPLNRIQFRLKTFRQITEASLGAVDLKGALQALAAGLGRLFAVEVVAALAVQEEEQVLVLQLREPLTVPTVDWLKAEMLSRFKALTGQELPPQSLAVEVTGKVEPGGALMSFSSTTMVPIISEGKVYGVLGLVSRTPDVLDAADSSFLYHAANHFSTVLFAQRRMHQLSIRDHLTGLWNRRHFEVELQRAWEAAQKEGNPLSVLMIDVDHFKHVNDTRGHNAGDHVLCGLANMILRHSRATDILCRYGGDEFVMVIPQGDDAAAQDFATRLVYAVRDNNRVAGLGPRLPTVSIGIASCVPAGNKVTTRELLKQADTALYEAKRAGRNRLVVWQPPEKREKSILEPLAMAPSVPLLPLPAPKREGGRILVVDDEPAIGLAVKRMLARDGYEVVSHSSVEEGVDEVRRSPSEFDMLFTDLLMPGQDGFEMLREVQGVDPSIVKVVFSGNVTTENAIQALHAGAYDILQKPFSLDSLKAVVMRGMEYRRVLVENLRYHHHLEAEVQAKSREILASMEELKSAYQFALETMVAMLNARERETGLHSIRVRDMTLVLGRYMGIPPEDLNDIGYGAFLHDIGKIGIPDVILCKPGMFTPEEREIMRQHPLIGYRFLEFSSFLKKPAEIVLQHHEHFDGSGYPRGLKGKEICLGARIFAAIDSYDAIRSSRVYQQSRPADVALAELRQGSGKQFDPEVVEMFANVQDEIEQVGQWGE